MEFENLTDFDPRDCIGGKVRRIALITSAVFRKYYAPFNITDSQASLLFILTQFGDKTQKELTEITKLEKSTLNRNLKRLIEHGYLSKDDFPKIKINLAGKILVNRIVPEWKKAMKEITEKLSEQGLQSLNIIHQSLTSKK